MHVLLIPSWYPDTPGDANGSFFREQAIALANCGMRVGVAYPNFRSLKKLVIGPRDASGIAVENDDGVQTYRLQGYNWTPRIPAGIHHQWVTRGLDLFDAYVAREGRPDVIHAHSMLFGGVLAAEIKRRHGVPFVITEHSTGYAKRLWSPYELRCAERAARAADRNLAVSDEFSTLLQGLFPTSATRWQTVPNMVHQDFFSHPLPVRGARQGFKFVIVALLNPIKQHDQLIRAFAATFPSEPEVTLAIAGDGPQSSALQALVGELRLQPRVDLLGRVERKDVPALLATADAFVLSSGYETFGVVVAEALAMGLPVVSTACGGPNTIVTEADGLLVDPSSVDELGLAMRRMRDGISRYDGQHIRERCLARYGEKAIVTRLASIYRDVLGQRHAAH